MHTVQVYSGDTSCLRQDALEQQFSFNFVIMSERGEKSLIYSKKSCWWHRGCYKSWKVRSIL